METRETDMTEMRCCKQKCIETKEMLIVSYCAMRCCWCCTVGGAQVHAHTLRVAWPHGISMMSSLECMLHPEQDSPFILVVGQT